uniref:hypothetical protein n=1 Tax=Timspurckia oligopyrenoides TaxID=708627 RepID=UPI001FCDA544|nr:hypothetical protein MW591_pgp119 [Timspurckia oligopyrenoides]UNJ17496.1 hypothetical protein [Timspurckia oligopyrenoides]
MTPNNITNVSCGLDLVNALQTLSDKDKLEKIKMIKEVDANSTEIFVDFLIFRRENELTFPSYLDGFIYETLLNLDMPDDSLLYKEFPTGILPLRTQKNIDYSDLQTLLIKKQFLEADKMTQVKLKELAGLDDREWLYFTDIQKIPSADLATIDKLWRIHSLDRFGFSIQRNIWLKANRDWDKLWGAIGWQINNNLCRYPNEFVWNINGPRGHLPLFNQLRGVQTLSALFNHQIWKDSQA